MPLSRPVPLSQVSAFHSWSHLDGLSNKLLACVVFGHHHLERRRWPGCAVLHAGTMPEIFSGERNPENGGHILTSRQNISRCAKSDRWCFCPISTRPCCTGACYLYARSFNPTVRYLGRQLAALEGTQAAYPTSSGDQLAWSTEDSDVCLTTIHVRATSTATSLVRHMTCAKMFESFAYWYIAEASMCASIGMAAITTTILQMCNSGDHIVASSAVYGE